MFREALLLLWRARREKTKTLQVRLFAFFALFAIALVGAAFILLTLTGVLDASTQRHRTWLDTETRHLRSGVLEDFSRLSLRGITLAETVALEIEVWARQNEITEKEITARPDLIEKLLAEEAGTLLTTLANNVCSGIFIIIDSAAGSTRLASATKAGLYFKRTETNNVAALDSKLYCLRGPASVARENKVELLGQWRAEFNVSDMDFYQKVLDAARRNSGTDLSRLYYWSDRYVMEGDSEHCMLLCVPLRSSDGTVYGLCGMVMGAMLFKNLYTPDGTDYPRVFTTLAPFRNLGLDTGAGLLAGNSYLTSRTNGLLRSADMPGNVSNVSWKAEEGDEYTGRMEPLKIYPAASPFVDEAWALAVLMPKEDWIRATRQSDALFYGAMAALLAVSLPAAVFISRRYIRPVVSALELLKTDDRAGLPKTQITEIDDLFEYLAELDRTRKTQVPGRALNDTEHKLPGAKNEAPAIRLEPAIHPAGESGFPVTAAYDQFRRNLKTFTASEHAVFNLYMKNFSAHEIADKLFVSINTVKFHNKNIYSKLGISSLKELKLYVTMMKEMHDAG
jgi:DNA-binding CsgD family transcriptional regulator